MTKVSEFSSQYILRFWGLCRDILSDNIFGRQNFRHPVELLAVLSNEFFSSVSYFPIQFTIKICFNMSFVLIWSVLDFSGQNFRRTKLFDGQNIRQQVRFSAVLSTEVFMVFCANKVNQTYFKDTKVFRFHEGDSNAKISHDILEVETKFPSLFCSREILYPLNNFRIFAIFR